MTGVDTLARASVGGSLFQILVTVLQRPPAITMMIFSPQGENRTPRSDPKMYPSRARAPTPRCAGTFPWARQRIHPFTSW